MDSLRRSPGVVGFVPVRWVHLYVTCVSSGSFAFVFNQACPGVRLFHSGALCGALGSFGFFGVIRAFVGFFRARPGERSVHSGALWVSFAIIWAHTGVGRFILVRWVHSGASWGSFGSCEHTLGVIGFIWFRCVHSCSSWPSLGSFVFGGFIRASPVCRRVLSALLGLFGRDLRIV